CRRRTRLDRVAEHLGHADLRAPIGNVLEPDHPPGDHRARRHDTFRAHLEIAVLRRPAPERRLLLAYEGAVAPGLLADAAAHRPGEVARLDARHPQRGR